MTETLTVGMAREDCITCGVVFTLPASLLDSRKRSGKTITCPNGHGFSYDEKNVVALKDHKIQKLDEEIMRLNSVVSATRTNSESNWDEAQRWQRIAGQHRAKLKKHGVYRIERKASKAKRR